MISSDTTPTYLIVAHQPLVAQDIADAVMHEIPAAEVIVATTVTAAIGLLARFEKIDVAFIEVKDAILAAKSLPEALLLAGTRIVLIGPETAIRWETLPMPFSADDLTQIIRRKGPLS